MVNKIDELELYVHEEKPHIIRITETWEIAELKIAKSVSKATKLSEKTEQIDSVVRFCYT